MRRYSRAHDRRRETAQASRARSAAKSATALTCGTALITAPVPLTRTATTPVAGGELAYADRRRSSGSATERIRSPIGGAVGSAGAVRPTGTTVTHGGTAVAVSRIRSAQVQSSASRNTAGRLLRRCTSLPSAPRRVRSGIVGVPVVALTRSGGLAPRRLPGPGQASAKRLVSVATMAIAMIRSGRPSEEPSPGPGPVTGRRCRRRRHRSRRTVRRSSRRISSISGASSEGSSGMMTVPHSGGRSGSPPPLGGGPPLSSPSVPMGPTPRPSVHSPARPGRAPVVVAPAPTPGSGSYPVLCPELPFALVTTRLLPVRMHGSVSLSSPRSGAHTHPDQRVCPPRDWAVAVPACYPGHSERGFEPMVFSVGETVVYPHHGAALIEAIETRVIKGEEKLYLVLRVAQGDLTVRVPAENAEIVGVREVVGEEGLTKVFDVLRAPHTEEPTNWSRRYKANLEKLASGNPLKVAEVVRDLWRRERERGLSAGEKRMLAKARDILVGEVALAEKSTKDEAEILLDKVLTNA